MERRYQGKNWPTRRELERFSRRAEIAFNLPMSQGLIADESRRSRTDAPAVQWPFTRQPVEETPPSRFTSRNFGPLRLLPSAKKSRLTLRLLEAVGWLLTRA